MLTRCPSCATTFRVTPEQLKAKAGNVRCGECQGVFNALDTLIEEVPVIERPPEPVVELLASPAAEPVAADEAAVPSAPTVEKNSFEEPSAPGNPADPADASEPEPAPAEAVFAPEPLLHEEEGPSPRRWPWALAGVTALLAFAVQGLLIFRVELAIMNPGWRPSLEALCDAAGCEVGLPRKVEHVGIESSDLHPEADSPGRLRLVATLRNRAPFAQEFPHLELTLTDASDKALVRRVLAPPDYLPKRANRETGFPASGDLAVSLLLETASLPAAGYRLYLFYP